MDELNGFIIARSIHVAAIVLWIGGVAFVTTVLLPALRKVASPADRLELFEQLEGRFATQARFITLAAGLSGYYMLQIMDAWARYQQLQFWWLHLMTFVWTLFTVVLFVLEPLVLHRLFKKQVQKDSNRAFKLLHRMHKYY